MAELWNELISLLSSLLENLNNISPDTRDVFAVIGAVSSAATILFTALAAILGFVGAALVALVGALGIVGTALLIILLLVLALSSHLFCALPTFMLACKKKSKLAFLSLLPIPYVKAFVQCDIPGKEPLKIFGSTLALKYRLLGCGVATIFSLLSIPTLILNLVLCTALNVVPGIGQFIALLLAMLSLIPIALVGYYNFLSLWDILNCFCDESAPNQRAANLFAALFATLLDDLVLQVPLARTILLYRVMLKKTPSPTKDLLVVEAEESEAEAVSTDV